MPAPTPTAEAPPAAGHCDAAAAGAVVGRSADAATIAAARVAAGAARARTLRPGEQGTMDYRADRLDLLLAADGTIRALRCG